MNNLDDIINSALILISLGRVSEIYQPNAKGIPFSASQSIQILRNIIFRSENGD
jgi:hypothetical protein